MRQTVSLQAERAWIEHQTAVKQIITATEQTFAAQKSLELAAERYRLELSSLVDLTDAQAVALRANQRLAEAQVERRIAFANLRWAMGMLDDPKAKR